MSTAEPESPKCPECDGLIICTRSEEGSSLTYAGQYHHRCTKCDFTDGSEIIREQEAGCPDEDSTCPLCNKVHFKAKN
jgi:hypothetical protein